MLGSSEPACPFADSSVPNPRLWKAGKLEWIRIPGHSKIDYSI
mgnify:CR=1 FL=1